MDKIFRDEELPNTPQLTPTFESIKDALAYEARQRMPSPLQPTVRPFRHQRAARAVEPTEEHAAPGVSVDEQGRVLPSSSEQATRSFKEVQGNLAREISTAEPLEIPPPGAATRLFETTEAPAAPGDVPTGSVPQSNAGKRLFTICEETTGKERECAHQEEQKNPCNTPVDTELNSSIGKELFTICEEPEDVEDAQDEEGHRNPCNTPIDDEFEAGDAAVAKVD